MIISHSHRFIFIKSAKTAGTSIESVLSNYCSGDDVVTPLGDYRFNRDKEGKWIHRSMNVGDFKQHDHGITIKEKLPAEVWNAYFKFSVARNPWDRVLSLFFWMHRNDPRLKPRRRFYHHLGVRFDKMGPVKELFAEFVAKGDWETNDRFYVIHGALCVDYAIRYENLLEGFSEVCKRVGVPTQHLPILKGGIRTKEHGYVEYYDEATKQRVAVRHENDLRLFGYRFGQS